MGDARIDGGARSGQCRSKLKSPHTSCGAAPCRATYRVAWSQEGAFEGQLGRNAVRHLGVQGIRPPAQSNQDVAPAGGVPQCLGQPVRLGAGRPLGGEHLPGRDALAHQDPHPTCRRIPNAPPYGLQGRPPERLRACRPGLRAHHPLRHRRLAGGRGLRDQHHVRPPVGDRPPMQAQGRDARQRDAHGAKVGLDVPAA